jgi:hypothetical protein
MNERDLSGRAPLHTDVLPHLGRCAVCGFAPKSRGHLIASKAFPLADPHRRICKAEKACNARANGGAR